jgi:hypothetical protein
LCLWTSRWNAHGLTVNAVDVFCSQKRRKPLRRNLLSDSEKCMAFFYHFGEFLWIEKTNRMLIQTWRHRSWTLDSVNRCKKAPTRSIKSMSKSKEGS